jgi:hypothetical protein
MSRHECCAMIAVIERVTANNQFSDGGRLIKSGSIRFLPTGGHPRAFNREVQDSRVAKAGQTSVSLNCVVVKSYDSVAKIGKEIRWRRIIPLSR